jgi:hypothetical protein
MSPEPMRPNHLVEHPEGGRFQEVFRSPCRVTTEADTTRSALTHIFFSVQTGEVSRFHRVAADEIWNLYQGAGLNLYLWDGTANSPQCVRLAAAENCFCHVVPAGVWQAAEPLSEPVLVGCSVAPGFEFPDFTLMDPASETARLLLDLDPDLQRYV